MPGPNPVSITVVGTGGGGTADPATMATGLSALSQSQLGALAIALMNAMAAQPGALANFTAAILAAVPAQSTLPGGIPAAGQAFVSTSGFFELGQ